MFCVFVCYLVYSSTKSQSSVKVSAILLCSMFRNRTIFFGNYSNLLRSIFFVLIIYIVYKSLLLCFALREKQDSITLSLSCIHWLILFFPKLFFISFGKIKGWIYGITVNCTSGHGRFSIFSCKESASSLSFLGCTGSSL